jgi:ribosomal protein S18 acetylase RimI-like enzyme
VEIRRFYVDRPFHGRGIAQALMRAVEETARTLGGRTLWLGVWERNPRAIAFYSKCGFVDVGQHDFILGTEEQTDRVMARALSP